MEELDFLNCIRKALFFGHEGRLFIPEILHGSSQFFFGHMLLLYFQGAGVVPGRYEQGVSHRKAQLSASLFTVCKDDSHSYCMNKIC